MADDRQITHYPTDHCHVKLKSQHACKYVWPAKNKYYQIVLFYLAVHALHSVSGETVITCLGLYTTQYFIPTFTDLAYL